MVTLDYDFIAPYPEDQPGPEELKRRVFLIMEFIFSNNLMALDLTYSDILYGNKYDRVRYLDEKMKPLISQFIYEWLEEQGFTIIADKTPAYLRLYYKGLQLMRRVCTRSS